jgi:hypothetical protein
MLTTPMGWLITGLSALAGILLYNSGLMDKLAGSTEAASQAYKELYDKNAVAESIHKKATEATSDRILKATILLDKVKATSVQESERKKALAELVAMDKEAFGGLISLAAAYDKGGAALEKYTAKMFEHAEAMAAVEAYKKVFADNIDAQWKNHERVKTQEYFYQKKNYDPMNGYSYSNVLITDEATKKRLRERDENNSNAAQRAKAQVQMDWLKKTFIKSDKEANNTLTGMDAPSTANAAAGQGQGEGNTAKGVVGAGPRTINIYITKMIERIDLHTTTVREGAERVADDLKEPLLRLLNSGAKMQAT